VLQLAPTAGQPAAAAAAAAAVHAAANPGIMQQAAVKLYAGCYGAE
jgi:hypothetical protein